MAQSSSEIQYLIDRSAIHDLLARYFQEGDVAETETNALALIVELGNGAELMSGRSLRDLEQSLSGSGRGVMGVFFFPRDRVFQ